MDQLRSIVVPVDFSDSSRAALNRATRLARLEGAAIHLIHVLPVSLVRFHYESSVPESVWASARAEAHQRLSAFRRSAESSGATPVTSEIVESSDPATTIVEVSEARDADLVVVGSQGHGRLKRAFLGSTAERIIRSSARPVYVVRDDSSSSSEPIQRILVPVDFSTHSDLAVSVGAFLADRLSAAIELLHVIEAVPEYLAAVFDGVDELETKARLSAIDRLNSAALSIQGRTLVNQHVIRGVPADVIASQVEQLDYDLVVMGTHGRSGIPHLLLGSVAERTLRSCTCSVLVVRAETTSPESSARART